MLLEKKPMIAFSIHKRPIGRKIEIDLDAEGMQQLVQEFEKLKAAQASFTRLTPDAGSARLAEKTPWGNPAVIEVVINYAEGDK